MARPALGGAHSLLSGGGPLKPRIALPHRPLVFLLLAVSLGAAFLALACGGNENSNAGSSAQQTPYVEIGSDGLPGTGFPSNGNEQIAPGQPHGSYYSNPPTSGWHVADLPQPGISDKPLTAEEVPNFLEHGGVWILYNCPSKCDDLVGQLTPIVTSANEQKKPVALAPYNLMDRKIAVVAWQRLLTLTDFNQTAIQSFIDAWVCKYNPQGGPYCPTAAGTTSPAKDAGSSGFTGKPATATPTAQAGKYSAPPPMTIDTNKTYVATIKTDKGDIMVELNAKAAPQTVNNFVFLAREHFYDGTTFHRVIPGFVAQGGDPTGTGTGGPGYTIPDEQNDLKHEEGVIAMAKSSAPNSAGSQFYITLAPQPSLDGHYTVFGKVTAGMDVVKSLTPRDPSKGGNLPPGDKIQTITIEEK